MDHTAGHGIRWNLGYNRANAMYCILQQAYFGTLVFWKNRVMKKSINNGRRAMRRGAQQGFTLIEVMVVVVILGILAALIVPNVMGRGEKAKVDTSKITLANVASALDQYKLDNNKYPTTQEGLDALINQPAGAKNWMAGGYLKGGAPKDSWDNDLQYVAPGSEGRPYDLYSFGADGKEGGEGNDADLYFEK